MVRAAGLMAAVTAEMGARAAMAESLKREAETAEAAAAIHREQAEAIRKMLDAELAVSASDLRKDVRRDSYRIGIASFVAGGGLTLLITLLVHPVH